MTIDTQDSDKKSDTGVSSGQQPEQEPKKITILPFWNVMKRLKKS